MEQAELIRVDPVYLADLLSHAWERAPVQLGAWDVQRITGGLDYTSSVHRLHGVAVVDGADTNWSLIVKVVRPDPQFDDPQEYRYWKREMLAYRSGLLKDLPGQFAAPRCYAIQEQPDGSAWIWLEEVQDELDHPWPIERYAQVARHLGRFNGAYLAGHPLPDDVWLTHNWLRNYLRRAAPMVDWVLQNPAHPVVRRALPGLALPLTLAFWDERARILAALDALPQTFCHQDAFGRNLFYRDAPKEGDLFDEVSEVAEVVALDWGYAGIAPVGAELAPLIAMAMSLAKFPSSQARELDRACFEGYLEGLREAGWEPDVRQVRAGFAFSLPTRYTLGAVIGELLPEMLAEETRARWAENAGVSEEHAGETEAGVVSYYQSLAIEELKLLGLGSILRVLGRTVYYALRLARVRRSETSESQG